MTDEPATTDPGRDAELRERLAADLAAGRTVALSASEMADPRLREALPDLLEDLGRDRPTDAPGLWVRGYTVLGEIGSGGMSTVYLARHEHLGRHDALKILQPAAGGQSRARERLLKEARAMAALRHPHIVTVYDVVEAGDLIAIAMEWVDGLTLAGILRALPRTPTPDDIAAVRRALGAPPDGDDALEPTVVRTFVRMVRDVARAVGCAHRAGMLHLDIKPSNVLVRRDGTALLADFGVVRDIDLALTHTMSFAGTPLYAAPEQLRRDDRSFSAATDVYGLGMTLYELLARVQPLRNEGLAEMLRRVEAGRVPRLSTQADVPRDLENVVHKAIAVEPGNRYATADALADDLDAFLAGRSVAAQRTSAIRRLRRWARAEPSKAALVTVLLVLVPGLLGLGAKLLLEMPRIADSRQRERRLEAAEAAQSAFQSFLVLEEADSAKIAELRAALALDRGNPTLVACLLAVLAQDHPEDAGRELAAMPERVRNGAGPRALLRRLDERRPFFAADETAILAASDDLLDMLLVVMDRVLLHRDSRVEEHLEEIQPVLERLNAGFEDANPLARGLEAWVAAELGDDGRLALASYALQHVWPDSEAACLWRVLATAARDPATASAIADEFLARHPGSYPVAVRAASLRLLAGEPPRAISILAGAAPGTAAGRRHHAMMTSRALFLAGREAEARRLFAQVAEPSTHDLGQWLHVAELLDPPAARRRYLEMVAGPGVSATYYQQAIDFANRTQDRELQHAAVHGAARAHPHRAAFRWPLARILCREGDLHGAAAALTNLTAPRSRVDHYGHTAAMAFSGTKDWQRMLRTCERWERFCRSDPRRMAFYLGVAASRTGDHERALAALERHFEEAARMRKPPHPEAWFERIWLHVAPDASAELNDPARALELLESRTVRRLLGERPRAWFCAIAAEVRFQNGEGQRALELVQQAEGLLDEPLMTAPADLPGLLARARERYR